MPEFVSCLAKGLGIGSQPEKVPILPCMNAWTPYMYMFTANLFPTTWLMQGEVIIHLEELPFLIQDACKSTLPNLFPSKEPESVPTESNTIVQHKILRSNVTVVTLPCFFVP
jgi:hypothetical protein